MNVFMLLSTAHSAVGNHPDALAMAQESLSCKDQLCPEGDQDLVGLLKHLLVLCERANDSAAYSRDKDRLERFHF